MFPRTKTPSHNTGEQKHANLGEQAEMEEITFTKDTVLSDVHLHIPHKRHLMVRLNAVGQPVFQTRFKILWENNVLEAGNSEQERNSDYEESEERCCGDELYFTSQTNQDIKAIEVLLDDDGDLVVQRRPQDSSGRDESHTCSHNVVCPTILTIGSQEQTEEEQPVYSNCDVVKIEHTMATPLEDVGKQIWRGAFVLADYILWQRDLFRGCTVLELGAGTGFTSIIMATVAKTVYCTDVGEDLLEMCERNVALNRCLTETTGGQVKVRELDWLNQFCKERFTEDKRGINRMPNRRQDADASYSWTEDDIADLYDQTTVILAADGMLKKAFFKSITEKNAASAGIAEMIFYDDVLTNALFKTISRITRNLSNPCTIYLSVERRFNFTLRHMDITCDAYNHFRNCLNNFESSNGKLKWSAMEIKTVFPQFFSYEREHLELWKVVAASLT
ncbi:methyltransferase-like protein 22 isoform X2 [Pseudophryne corroboree]|uniref:methyltransferase-like protein 22 isoform X2 n=1 Tax=Pseudophryne corroboree TaxID=495146 RepID=UPI003081ECEA